MTRGHMRVGRRVRRYEMTRIDGNALDSWSGNSHTERQKRDVEIEAVETGYLNSDSGFKFELCPGGHMLRRGNVI